MIVACFLVWCPWINQPTEADPRILVVQAHSFGVDLRAAESCRRMSSDHRWHHAAAIFEPWRDAWADGMRHRERAWELLRDSLDERFEVETRLYALHQLHDLIGDEMYFGGRMPQVIPNYGDR